MNPILLDNVTFWDVVWWMIIAYFFVLIIWMFISIFSDIFRRRDINGWVKALWIAVIFIIPFIGIILYLCFRPRATQADQEMMYAAAPAGYSSADEIARAQGLLNSGAITQAEFDTLKARALM